MPLPRSWLPDTPPPQEYVAVNDSFGESGTPDQLLTNTGWTRPTSWMPCAA
jgi:hypothetical protein